MPCVHAWLRASCAFRTCVWTMDHRRPAGRGRRSGTSSTLPCAGRCALRRCSSAGSAALQQAGRAAARGAVVYGMVRVGNGERAMGTVSRRAVDHQSAAQRVDQTPRSAPRPGRESRTAPGRDWTGTLAHDRTWHRCRGVPHTHAGVTCLSRLQRCSCRAVLAVLRCAAVCAHARAL